MEWLNYHHLYYFWTVARCGSVARASEELRLSPPAISNQIRSLEESLGEKLLERSGRGLVLTEMGRIAMRYADEIFSLGREFTDTMKDIPTGRPIRFCVGIADVLPKLIAFHLLEPALKMKLPIRIVCREDRPDHLLADLSVHDIDIVLNDAPIGSGATPRFRSQLLVECGVAFFSRDVRWRKGFPGSLDGAPFLLPTDNTAFRRSLDEWFYEEKIHPKLVGEFADFALLRVFAEEGYGVIAAPLIIEKQVCNYGLHKIGQTNAIRTRYYAVSVERKVQHPCVAAIYNAPETVWGRKRGVEVSRTHYSTKRIPR